jgi:YjbE family integral membrane protein
MDFIAQAQTADFWINLFKIIWINVILSGDNAVVIALAARSLPPRERKLAIIWGSGAAVILLVVLTIVAAQLMALPYLQLVGGALLLWIGVKLLAEEDGDDGQEQQHSSLMAAIRTILIADLVMSLDNVIGVAAAAKGEMTLLILGLAISIPVVVFSSSLMITVMTRFPILVTLGAALIGWVGGEALLNDAAIKPMVLDNALLEYGVPALCAIGVVVLGNYFKNKGEAKAHSEEHGE